MRYLFRAILLGVVLGLLVLVGLGTIRPEFLQLYSAADWGLALIALVGLAIPAAIVVWILLRLGSARDLLGGRAGLLLPLSLLGFLLVTRLLVGMLDSPSKDQDPSVVILGLDGANWPIIDRLIGRGDLPNFERLKQSGVSGVFRSEEPTLSPRVWTTIATGVAPDLHGASDFFSTQDSIREPRLWEIVSVEGGGTIGVWEWLLTWPPAQLDGFIVPGWLTRGAETQPEDLEFFQRFRTPGLDNLGLTGKLQLATACYWHGVRLSTLVKAVVSTVRLATMDAEERRNRPDSTLIHAEMSSDLFLARWRREEPEFSSLVLYATDSLAHRFWMDFEPEAFVMEEAWVDQGRGWILPAAYKQADRLLGRMMAELPEQSILVVLSDHGTKANQDSFTKYSIRSANLIEILGMEGQVAGFSVGRLLQMRENDPDPTRSTPEFAEILEAATVGGRPLFKVEVGSPPFYRVSVRGNPSVDDPADIGGRRADLKQVLFRREVSGDHTLDGMLAFWGEGVRPGGSIQGSGLRDVAPTVLAYLGLPATRNMSGRVLREVFTDRIQSRLHTEVVDAYSFSVEDLRSKSLASPDEEVRERLKALGYLE